MPTNRHEKDGLLFMSICGHSWLKFFNCFKFNFDRAKSSVDNFPAALGSEREIRQHAESRQADSDAVTDSEARRRRALPCCYAAAECEETAEAAQTLPPFFSEFV